MASGRNDGYGLAVHPDELKSEHFSRLVGVVVESGMGAFNTVNVAVGLNTAMAKSAQKMESRAERMERETEAMKNVAMAFVAGSNPTHPTSNLRGCCPR